MFETVTRESYLGSLFFLRFTQFNKYTLHFVPDNFPLTPEVKPKYSFLASIIYK